jgi:UTP--glucose-1-phosphate uridylyltransferase
VILPDDDLEESCLESMIDIYSREKCCVIAVRHVEETDEDSYGMVSVKHQSGSICIIADLQEKPLDKFPGQSLAIIGRYIITPDIFKALELTGANESGEIELTDAIRKISGTQPIYGHLYTGEVTSLSPSRRLLEKMILSRDKRAVQV